MHLKLTRAHKPTVKYTLFIPLLYSGKLLREKTFMNFMVLWLFAKVFSTNIVFSPIRKFSYFESFALHGTYTCTCCEAINEDSEMWFGLSWFVLARVYVSVPYTGSYIL